MRRILPLWFIAFLPGLAWPADTATGTLRLTYPSQGGVRAYKLHVPSSYTPNHAWPLVLALHGAGDDENKFFMSYNNGAIRAVAETHGYLVACPFGSRNEGYTGAAAQDVWNVLADVCRRYSIDRAKGLFLFGHSMGGSGALYLAATATTPIAGVASMAGPGHPSLVEKLKLLPVYLAHGSQDEIVPVQASRAMAESLNQAGVQVVFQEIPGADHNSFVAQEFEPVFAWFDQLRGKGEKP